MPFWIITIGFGSARASPAVNAFSFDTTTNGRGRPSAEVPKEPTRISGIFASSRRRKARVSS
jgi:hypothetical protein